MIIPAIICVPWVYISIIGFLRESIYLTEAGFCSPLPIRNFPMALQVLWEQNQNSPIETIKILLQTVFLDFQYSFSVPNGLIITSNKLFLAKLECIVICEPSKFMWDLKWNNQVLWKEGCINIKTVYNLFALVKEFLPSHKP